MRDGVPPMQSDHEHAACQDENVRFCASRGHLRGAARTSSVNRIDLPARRTAYRKQAYEGINHHITHSMNLGRSNPFTTKILVSIGRRSEEQIGKLVSDQAIDFFRHAAVARAETCLDMPNLHLKFGANQSRSHG